MHAAFHPPIAHDPQRQRFTLQQEGHEAELDYLVQDGRLVITHTGRADRDRRPRAGGWVGDGGIAVCAGAGNDGGPGLRVCGAVPAASSRVRRSARLSAPARRRRDNSSSHNSRTQGQWT